MTRLLTVEDTFLISGRGLIVEPSPTVEEVRGPGDLEVELRLPDGTRRAATLTLAHVFISPTPAIHRWGCTFKSLGKEDVPIGTQIWCSEEVFLAPGEES